MKKPRKPKLATEDDYMDMAQMMLRATAYWVALSRDEDGLILGFHKDGLDHFQDTCDEDFPCTCIQGPFLTMRDAERARDQMIVDHKLGEDHEVWGVADEGDDGMTTHNELQKEHKH
jgi:hypothetical protein